MENKPSAPYIDPLNPYTGDVSVMAIMHNWENGHREYPRGMGETRTQVIVETKEQVD